MRRALIDPGLDQDIRAAVGKSPRLDALVRNSLDTPGKLPLAIKYIPAKWAGAYKAAGGRLKVSTTPGFTWGTGTYVAPTAFPLSTAIYGRVGVVAEFDPAGWNVFDGTDPAVQMLYLHWVGFQPLYRILALTMHASLANQILRDHFRTIYQIDCVLFHPDQFNSAYTSAGDVWMNVTDWTPAGEIDTQFSARFTNPRMTVLIEEEFEPDTHDIARHALIGPLGPLPAMPGLQQAVAAAYAGGKLYRVPA
jgi:hypothetical protein